MAMKKRKKPASKKMIVFFMVHLTLMIYMILIISFSKESLSIMGNYIIWAQIANAGIASGCKLGDDIQKSIYYKEELDNEK
jgi:hypothetical protein